MVKQQHMFNKFLLAHQWYNRLKLHLQPKLL